ncbi:MAG: hypothetical protein LBJ92_00160 [Holosporales bacterium]|jgi:hypothetical protein|nr:hypothetical protein [Holosporales bacterium]
MNNLYKILSLILIIPWVNCEATERSVVPDNQASAPCYCPLSLDDSFAGSLVSATIDLPFKLCSDEWAIGIWINWKTNRGEISLVQATPSPKDDVLKPVLRNLFDENHLSISSVLIHLRNGDVKVLDFIQS